MFKRTRWTIAIGPLLATLLICAACTHKPAPPIATGSGNLSVTLVGFRNDQGHAVISLFASPRGFPDDVTQSLLTQTVPIHQQQAETVFHDLPYGDYALSVLHDENDDGRMDASWLGRPREGFGFSGHPTYLRGRPDFAESSILMVVPARTITVSLRYATGRQEHQDANRAKALKRLGN